MVDATQGVEAQTVANTHLALNQGLEIVPVLNKIDLPGANPDKALQDLAAHELLPSEWGGDVEVIKTSAISGDGVDDLLETLLLTAEIHEYTANPARDATGVCLEAQQDVDDRLAPEVSTVESDPPLDQTPVLGREGQTEPDHRCHQGRQKHRADDHGR